MKERINLSSNIIDNSKTEFMIGYTLETLANSLSKSVGPYGSNTIIQDGYGNHSITKDGYTIFKSLVLENDISKTILDIIKTISLKLVNEVGDASTSSILVAYKLYMNLSKYKDDNCDIAPKMLKDILTVIENIIIDMIKECAIQITEDNFDVISKVASISNNNDYKLGNLIYEIYSKIGKNSFINIESSKSKEDYYEITDGYEILNGYVDQRFINEEKDQTFVAENPLIFISNSDLDESDLNILLKLCGFSLQNKKPLVIIAKGFSEEVYNFLMINKFRNKENLMICPILYTLGTTNREESLKDLKAYVDSHFIYDKIEMKSSDLENEFLENYGKASKFLGTCKKVICDSKRTKFIESSKDAGAVEYLNRRLESIKYEIDKLKEKSEREENDVKLFELEQRYNKLNGSIATFYVGGNTELEKKNKRYLVDDAIHAVRSAIDSGYIIGGNLTIPSLIHKNKYHIVETTYNKFNGLVSKEVIESVVLAIGSSFLYSYECVLKNRFRSDKTVSNILDCCIEDGTIFNLITNKYENVLETNVINSADTDIQILHSVFSIIGLLVTSNQFISISTYGENAFDDIMSNTFKG